MPALRPAVAAAALAIALLAAACGGGELDTEPAVAEANRVFADLGVTLACPGSVDPAADFTCTLAGSGGDAIEVRMRIVEVDGENALDAADEPAFEDALMRAAGAADGGGGTDGGAAG